MKFLTLQSMLEPKKKRVDKNALYSAVLGKSKNKDLTSALLTKIKREGEASEEYQSLKKEQNNGG